MFSTETPQETALVIHPVLPKGERDADYLAERLEEAAGLARAINLEVLDAYSVNVSNISAGNLLSKGIIENIAKQVEELEPNVVIMDATLSPVQQRNLERAFNAKVIDRTGLILEIFGDRAQTKEGRIQVDLALLEYQRSRLVRAWTHLERQRGSTGFVGGPGETQIELDRRLIGDRITKLKKELQEVRRTRNLAKSKREKVPFPVVALVGYTNAGKSTLFNHLTGANVYAEDLPFATLDPTMRKLQLKSGQEIILSDTVGFISDLPTHLVEAFRATLEQVVEADIIIHVRDISRPDNERQAEDVIEILESLGVEYEEDARVMEVWNKIDKLDAEDFSEVMRKAKFRDQVCAISALTGEGFDYLFQSINDILSHDFIETEIHVPVTDGRNLAWLYENAEVLGREDNDNEINLKLLISESKLKKYKQQQKK